MTFVLEILNVHIGKTNIRTSKSQHPLVRLTIWLGLAFFDIISFL